MSGVTVTQADRDVRRNLSDFEQMIDAQCQCVPCKLCGGSAVISCAGEGAGYYIACENGNKYRPSGGCLINERRLGGWAYNVMDWWNRLHSNAASIEAEQRAFLEGARAMQEAAALKAELQDDRDAIRALDADAMLRARGGGE